MLISLKAPVSGVLLPIEQVPDPVFSQRTVGDGISIDPTSATLVAPCSGEVLQVHSAGHALTIQAPEGLQVMLHVGLDTVALKGKGFRPRVKAGAHVQTGDPLIEFDADFVAGSAKSLLTQMIVMNADGVAEFRPRSGNVVAAQDTVLDLVMGQKASGQSSVRAEAGPVLRSEPIAVRDPDGLHARPVAVFAAAAKKYNSDITLSRAGREANAKSIVSVMSLEVNFDDSVVVSARGADAQEALNALTAILRGGMGEGSALKSARPAEATAPKRVLQSSDSNLLAGVSASVGLAVGNVFRVEKEEFHFEENARDAQAEFGSLGNALNQASAELDALEARLSGTAESSQAAIFGAHREILADPELLELVDLGILRGKTAAFAWNQAIEEQAGNLAGLKNELLAARANDVRDVGRRVLRLLAGQSKARKIDAPANAILISEDLSPSDIAGLDRSRVLGFCTLAGGATSHVAILARSLGIPAVAGIDPRALSIASGTPVILDGTQGFLRLNPSVSEVARIQGLQEKHERQRKADASRALEPAVTLDGHLVEVAANIAGAADAEQGLKLGAEGVGLLRSEFLFLERATAPSEEEQYRAYAKVAQMLGPDRPLVIRTLDVGGDKPLAYLPIPKEDNPFLGERGIRVGLERPEILRTQIRAILRAASSGKVMLMFPMIATIEELKRARAVVAEESRALGVALPAVGIMVEVPSAAILAERFAPYVDFFSIGTNDLTQYVLAMDRGHPKLASRVDGLDPAVLKLIDLTVRAAHRNGKWVGVCGGIASEAAAVPILLGLGVDEFSVSVPAIPAIKAQIRSLKESSCREIAREALEKETASEVRALVAPLLSE